MRRSGARNCIGDYRRQAGADQTGSVPGEDEHQFFHRVHGYVAKMGDHPIYSPLSNFKNEVPPTYISAIREPKKDTVAGRML